MQSADAMGFSIGESLVHPQPPNTLTTEPSNPKLLSATVNTLNPHPNSKVPLDDLRQFTATEVAQPDECASCPIGEGFGVGPDLMGYVGLRYRDMTKS